MNLDDFSYTENDRRYINPQVSLDEQNAFINNLRNNQQDWSAQNATVTRNLGSALPSNLGGLTGGSGYFASRYQTPQTNSMISDLRAAAQSQALSTVMNNEIAKAQKRYQDAYRAAKKRENANGGNGGNGNDLAEYLKELKTNLVPDDSSDPLDTQGVDDITGASKTTRNKQIDLLKKNIAVKEQQIADMKKQGPLYGDSDWEKFVDKITVLPWIARSNQWASRYNKYNSELDDLRKQLAELEGN